MKLIDIHALHEKWLEAREQGKACTIIDVREAGEYMQAHIPGVKLITLGTVPSRSDEFPKNGDVYVVCQLGGRSAQAIQFLEQNYGHQNLVNVTGGTKAWVDAGYPIEQGES